MARLSSASTETDYVPVMIPFNWEAVPGRPASQEITEIIEVPSLPLPPGKRPKDGFYLPFCRPAQSPSLQNEAEGINSSPGKRRTLNLKFPGSSKKPLFTSRKLRKLREDTGCVEDTHAGPDIFNPVSGHRFGSRITRRVLVEFQKRRSCLGGCLPFSPGRNGSSSQNHHHRSRRFDSAEDSNEEEIQEPYPTPIQSAASSGSPLSSSSSHDHGRARDSSVPGARKKLQVPSSRFMASMLISLCPDESDGSDEAEAVDTGNGITEDCSDEIGFSEHLTMPRARVSSPEAIFPAPQREIVVDPASQTGASHEERTRAWVDMSTNTSRVMSESSLHEESAIDNLCEYCKNRKFQQPKISHGTDDVTNEAGQRYTVADHKGNVADTYSASNTKASADRELRLRPTRGSCKSSFSWKPSNQIGANRDPLAVFVTSNVQEPGESVLANEKYGSVAAGEEIKRRGSCSSLARNFSTRHSNCSSSSETRKPLHKFVCAELNARDMVDSLSTPRSSCGDSEFSFITNSSVDNLKAKIVRWSATPTAESSLLRRNSLEEQPEPNPPPASRPISSFPHTLLQNQVKLQITAFKNLRIKDNLKVPSTSPVWLATLKSSSLWPNPSPKMSAHAAANGDSDDESGEDESEISSTDSSEYETPRAVSQTPSLTSPVLCNFNLSTKPVTWEVSEKLLKSSSLLKHKQQREQSHESPRSSFVVDQDSTTLPGPSSPDHDSKGVVPEGRFSETSQSNSGVMRKVAQWESRLE